MVTIFRVEKKDEWGYSVYEYFDTLNRAIEYCDKNKNKQYYTQITIDMMIIENGAKITRVYYII